MKFHTSGSGATLRGYGTELDFIRPGISIYGLPPGLLPSSCEKTLENSDKV